MDNFFNLTPDQKQQLIINNFQNINLQPTNLVPYERLTRELDKLIGREFDRQVSEQLTEQCQIDPMGNIQIGEFIKVVMQAYSILEKKVADTKGSIEMYEQQKQETVNKVEEAKVQKQQFKSGVGLDSNLTVNCLEARNLPGYSAETPICILTCGREKFQTAPGSSIDLSNPKWNSDFVFSIETGSEDLVIEVLGYNTQSNSNVILGECVIKLQNLYDQSRCESWFQLYDTNNNAIQAEIFLGLQYIHDKVQYFSDMLQKFGLLIENLQNDQFDYYQDLNLLVEMMGHKNMYGGPQYQQQEYASGGNDPYQQQYQDGNYNPQQQQQLAVQSQNHQQYEQEGRAQNMYGEDEDKPVYRQDGARLVDGYLKYMFILAAVILFDGLLQCLNRSSFMDLTIGFCIGFILIIDCFERLFIKGLLGYTVISIVLDLLWIHFYMSGIWNQDKYDVQSVNKFICILVIFNMIFKAGLSYVLYQIYLNMENQFNEKYYIEFQNVEYTFGHLKKNVFLEAFAQSEGNNFHPAIENQQLQQQSHLSQYNQQNLIQEQVQAQSINQQYNQSQLAPQQQGGYIQDNQQQYYQ